MIEECKHWDLLTGRLDCGQKCLCPCITRALIVEPGGADQFLVHPHDCAGRKVVCHQFPAENRRRGYTRTLGDKADERLGLRTHAPDSVDVPLRIQRHTLAIFGQVDSQLRNTKNRVVDANQLLLQSVSHPDTQSSGDTEIAVEPRVQPRTAVRFEAYHLPPGRSEVGMLFDPQVRAVGMTSDNPERSGTSHTLGAPGDQRTASHEEVPSGLGWPRLRFVDFDEPAGRQLGRHRRAHMERRR